MKGSHMDEDGLDFAVRFVGLIPQDPGTRHCSGWGPGRASVRTAPLESGIF